MQRYKHFLDMQAFCKIFFATKTGFEPVLSYMLYGCQLNVFQSAITLPIAFATWSNKLSFKELMQRYKHFLNMQAFCKIFFAVRTGFEPVIGARCEAISRVVLFSTLTLLLTSELRLTNSAT